MAKVGVMADVSTTSKKEAGSAAALMGVGAAAAAVGAGVAYFLARLFSPAADALTAVASLTPAPAKAWAVQTFGTYAELFFLLVVLAVIIALTAVTAIWERSRVPLGSVVILAAGATGCFTVLAQPGARLADILPTLAGVGCAIAVLRLSTSGRITDRTVPAGPVDLDRRLSLARISGFAAAGLVGGVSVKGVADLTTSGGALDPARNATATLNALGRSRALPFYVTSYGVIADGEEHNNVANLLDCFAACAAAGGGVILLPAGTIATSDADLGTVTADSGNTYINNGGIPLPEDTSLTVEGQGVGLTTLRLSAGFTRGFDFWRKADGENYQNITIRGITFDRDDLRATDIAPLTQVTSTVTLVADNWTTIPGLSAEVFKNAQIAFLPRTNAGTAKNILMWFRIFEGNVQLGNLGGLGNLTLNAGDYVSAGLTGHIIAGCMGIGYYSPGDSMTIDNVLIEDCEATNIYTYQPADADEFYADYGTGGVAFWIRKTTTAASVTNLTCRRVKLYGGLYGFNIVGDTGTWFDNIWFEDCFHDTMVLPAHNRASLNYMVGADGYVGRCGVTRCTGRRSWDVGVEFDQAWEAYEIDCVWEECWAAVYRSSFVPPARTSAGPPTATLNNGGTLTAGLTTLTVTALPDEADRHGLALIDRELVWYQTANAAGTAWNIWRGINGSTPATHANGATVTFVQTDKTRMYSIRSTVRNEEVFSASKEAGKSWLTFENRNLPVPPLAIRDAQITLSGGGLADGQVMKTQGWCPEIDIQGLRVTQSGLNSTESSAYGSGAIYQYSEHTGAMYSAGVPCPAPLIFGRNNRINVNGKMTNALQYSTFAQTGGWNRYDLVIEASVMIAGASERIGFSALIGVIAAGSRLQVMFGNPFAESGSYAVLVNGPPGLTLAGTVDIDASFTDSNADSGNAALTIDSAQSGKVALRS